MNDEKMLISKSDTIGVREMRTLMELSQTVGKMITHDEYAAIASDLDISIFSSFIFYLLIGFW